MTHNQGPEASSSSLSDLLEEKNLRTKAVEVLERGLEATLRFYDVINDTFIDVPDHRIRLAAAMAALAYPSMLGSALTNKPSANNSTRYAEMRSATAGQLSEKFRTRFLARLSAELDWTAS